MSIDPSLQVSGVPPLGVCPCLTCPPGCPPGEPRHPLGAQPPTGVLCVQVGAGGVVWPPRLTAGVLYTHTSHLNAYAPLLQCHKIARISGNIGHNFKTTSFKATKLGVYNLKMAAYNRS